MKQTKTTNELQRICFEALKRRSGFEALDSVEIRARTAIEGGANWTLVTHPRIETTALRSARDVIGVLQQSYELTNE